MKDANPNPPWQSNNKEYLIRIAVKVGPQYWDIPGCSEDSVTPDDVIKYIKERKNASRIS